MSRDPWLTQLRIAGADTRSVEEVLAGDVPADGLQHAGSALLRVERSDALVAVARQLVEPLGHRGWTGDAELIVELEHYVGRTASDLTTLPVALDELGEALDQSGGSAIRWTIEQPDLASRLTDAPAGSGAFRRFQNELSRHEDEYTRWHRFDASAVGSARPPCADRRRHAVQPAHDGVRR